MRLELQEAIITFRQQITLATQIAGFIVAADSVLLAYGFAQRESGIFLIASFLPIVLLVSYLEIFLSTVPVICVAITLEKRLQLRSDSLARTFARTNLRHIFSTFDANVDLEAPGALESVVEELRWSLLNKTPGHVLELAFIAQFILFLVSLLTFHYRFM
jgi:hypothetical protein